MAAAFLQNLRGYLQKEFQSDHGTLAATYARFGFGFPFALLYAYWLLSLEAGSADVGAAHYASTLITAKTLAWGSLGAIAQIFATFWLVMLYRLRHFAVGTALSKTETIQTFVFGWIILGEGVGLLPFVGILVSLVAVLLLSSTTPIAAWRIDPSNWFSRSALLGIGAGAGFGISGVSYRAASLSLTDGGVFARAALTLALVLFIQTVLMGLWLAWRDRGAFKSFLAAPRQAVMIGIVSVLGSAGWFTAMTLQNAALVRALGQIELVFSFLTARFIMKQSARPTEVLGIAALIVGLLLIILPDV